MLMSVFRSVSSRRRSNIPSAGSSGNCSIQNVRTYVSSLMTAAWVASQSTVDGAITDWWSVDVSSKPICSGTHRPCRLNLSLHRCRPSRRRRRRQVGVVGTSSLMPWATTGNDADCVSDLAVLFGVSRPVFLRHAGEVVSVDWAHRAAIERRPTAAELSQP